MKIAYLLLAHKYPEQLKRLILRLRDEHTSFFIHIDKKTDDAIYNQIVELLNGIPNVYFTTRYKCYWGDFNIVKASIAGIKMMLNSGTSFDYAVLLSGQDYSLKSNNQIKQFFQENKGKEFIEFFSLYSKNPWTKENGHYPALERINYWHLRFRSKHFYTTLIKRRFPSGFEPFGGSQWWCLSRACLEYVNSFIPQNPQLINYLKYVYVPDEIFFQTIILNSPFKDKVSNDHLRYMDWENPNPNVPATLCKGDFEKLSNSSKLFARKFDLTRDPEILDLIDQKILDEYSASK